VGDIIIGIGLRFLDDAITPWALATWGNFLFLCFEKNWVKIRVFVAFDWSFSVCSLKVMAAKHKLIYSLRD